MEDSLTASEMMFSAVAQHIGCISHALKKLVDTRLDSYHVENLL